MLTEEEEKFIAYWAANGAQQKKGVHALLKGFSSGISIGAGIILLLLPDGMSVPTWKYTANSIHFFCYSLFL